MKKPVQGGFPHRYGGQQNEDGNQKSADIFHASVAVWVSAVFSLAARVKPVMVKREEQQSVRLFRASAVIAILWLKYPAISFIRTSSRFPTSPIHPVLRPMRSRLLIFRKQGKFVP